MFDLRPSVHDHRCDLDLCQLCGERIEFDLGKLEFSIFQVEIDIPSKLCQLSLSLRAQSLSIDGFASWAYIFL